LIVGAKRVEESLDRKRAINDISQKKGEGEEVMVGGGEKRNR